MLRPGERTLAISDWGLVPLRVSRGEIRGDILVLPISPTHALCAASASLDANSVERVLSAIPLGEITEAAFGIDLVFRPGPNEDLSDVASRPVVIERLRESMRRWRSVIQLQASLPSEQERSQ
jgi:hypothetical protein